MLAGAGEVSHLDVADMHGQVAARARRLAETALCGVLAVVGVLAPPPPPEPSPEAAASKGKGGKGGAR